MAMTVDLQRKLATRPVNWRSMRVAVSIGPRVSQFSDAFVTLLQQTESSAVLAFGGLFLLKILWL